MVKPIAGNRQPPLGQGWGIFTRRNGDFSVGVDTIDEINTVAPDGRTYKGTFTATFYDLNGNVLQQQKGTQTAKRITVNTTGAP